jgi:hypothetical protein
MQYKDGDAWKYAGDLVTGTVAYNSYTLDVSYTHHIPKTNVTIDEVMLFENAISDSNVVIRLTCAANWQASGSGPLAAPNGGTIRFSSTEPDQDTSTDSTDHSPYMQVVE